MDTRPWVVPADWDDARRLTTLGALAEWGARDLAVVAVASGFATDTSATGRAHAALGLVHGLPFRPDPPGVDTYQPAAYTLQHGGDCEDLAVLLAALCAASGVRARLVQIQQPAAPQNHVTVEVRLLPSGPWVWAEPSVPSARLGEDPYEAARRAGREDRIRGVR